MTLEYCVEFIFCRRKLSHEVCVEQLHSTHPHMVLGASAKWWDILMHTQLTHIQHTHKALLQASQ